MSTKPYVTERLSVADNMLSPRRYMRTALCLPIPQTTIQSKLLRQLKLAVRQTVIRYPFLLGSLRIDPCDEKKNSLIIDIPKDILSAASDSITLNLEDQTNHMDYDTLQAQGFPCSRIANTIARDPHDPVEVEDGCPVFSLRVAFIRNGIVLSACLHHSLADGPAFSEVVESVISGLDQDHLSEHPTVACHLHLDSFEHTLQMGDPRELIQLCPDRMFRDEIERATKVLKPSLEPFPPVRCKIFQYDLANLMCIRKEILNALTNAYHSGRLASTNDCIGAYTWAHVLRARLAKKSLNVRPKESRLFIPVDFRQRVTPNLPPTYFGNAIITVPVTMSTATLITACGAFKSYNGKRALAKVAQAIRKASDAVDDDYIRRRLNLGKSLADMRAVRLNVHATSTVDMIFNSLATLDAGLTRCTFVTRQGKQVAIRPLMTDVPANMCVMLPQLNSVAELVLALYEDDMEELLATKSWMMLVKRVVD